ncbi:hypothetical protein [Acetobacter malorum]|uniref:hypothetical protein n=1 Tax=Acetobacter malorum TaxID=178901 RepID=UPI0039ED1C9E
MANFIWGANGEEVTPEEIAQRKQMAQSLLAQSQQQPANYWTQGLANMANALMGGFMQGRAMRAERANDDFNKDALASLLQQGSEQPQAPSAPPESSPAPAVGAPSQSISPVAAALTNPQTGETSPAAQNGASDLIAQGLLDHMRQAESGGDNTARNPRSSATGAYQFTSPTWAGLMRQHPELGLTADGRTDPAQSEAAARQLASDNIAYMLAKGVQNPTQGQAYLAHFAGAPAATNIIQADPSASAASILSPAQVAANPFLRGMTAGQVQDWAAQKMGGPAPQTQQMATPQPSAGYGAPALVQSGPSMSTLIGVLSDPRANKQTQGVASALLNNQLQLQQVQQRYAMEQADPENQARMRYYDAETNRLMNPQQKQAAAYSLLSPQQAQQMGLDPSKSYQMDGTGKIMQIGNSGVNVTLNNGPNTSEFQKKSDDEAATRIGGYISEGAQAPAMMGQLQQLSDLSRNIGTGKGAQFTALVGPYAQALGLNVKGLDQRQAFNAIVDRMVPQMRPAGSGPQSDADARMFMTSLPQLGNTDRGNQIIAGTLQAIQQNKLQAADIAAQAQKGQISWQDAESQIRKLPNPYEQFKKAHADLAGNTGEVSGGGQTTATGVKWSVR